ncbi:MAG: TAXI family TRAP transporter solute-binding subunit [Rhodospirillum sp.]|nr:TAXI family TRAP transporter solute-binding subunit [Rhodospirillum sp.]MCF8488855.1 TAXI family TRAP transporter solute-binding subunit [Rhodospirillum sp.]MCF8500658.1 TAXI family TRAP transporter solute-binding subunit [Rhodospirillum sp.]
MTFPRAPLGKTLLCGLTAALIATPALATDKLLIGSTSGSSSHYGYFVAVGKLINDSVKNVEASVVETGATLDNLRRLERDQVDLGLVTTNVAQHAVAGTGEFEGHPIDLRLLWVYTGAPQNVVARADAGLSTLADLTGKRFNPGIRGSATESTTEAVLAKLGIAPDYVRGSTSDIVNMIKDNRLNGYVKSGSGQRLDASTIDIATFTDINILSLDPGQAATLKAEMPDISVVDIPAGAGEGIPAYTTWSFGVGAATTPEMDEDTAYQIVKAVMEDKSAQAAAMASLKGADLAELTLTYGTIPLHPGAARYFKERGLDIPDRLLPPAK